MKMRLYAAVVSEKSDLPELQALNGLGKAVQQAERLKQLVEAASQEITKSYQRDPPKTGLYQSVFVAPEYFFSNRRRMNDRFFSHDVKRYIIETLRTLAKKYPKMLIIPGTVLWTKDLYTERVVDTFFGPLRPGQTQYETQVRPVAPQQRMDKVVARRTTARDTYGTTTSTKDWDYTKDAQTAERKLAQNVAYICLGDTMLKYHKVGNYKEVAGEADDLVFVPGSIVGRFAVGGVKYGLEVCMDHALGVVNKSVTAHGKVHIQIVVSSYVGLPENADASVTIHASTEESYYYTEGDKSKPTATKQIRFGHDGVAKLADRPWKAGSLTVWPIDLDAGDISNVASYQLTSNFLQPVKVKATTT
jgi:hypothetical protein